jgi:DNA modification methylase
MKQLLKGDCLEVLKTLPSNSIDSLVTDPPAGISFMGKEWDEDKGGKDVWIKWMSSVMRECLRVLKPGAHGLVWAIPRTSHWTGMALENSGFEVRDVVTHLFGQGFPKSLNISKAIDKVQGAKREVVGKNKNFGKTKLSDGKTGYGDYAGEWDVTTPATPEAKQWEGWGTALKPAVEFWFLIRKPIEEKSVASNVLKHGTGGINIDASRINATDQKDLEKNWDRTAKAGFGNGLLEGGTITEGFDQYKKQGRFPSNLVLSHDAECKEDRCSDECAVKLLDYQSGNLGKSSGGNSTAILKNTYGMKTEVGKGKPCGFGDVGGASRFFFNSEYSEEECKSNANTAKKNLSQKYQNFRFIYCAKISSGERNAGLDGMPTKTWKEQGFRDNDTTHLSPRAGAGRISVNQNHHPTVKPIKLMRYLIKLITPPKGIVLDPFMGSGSTGVAAMKENFEFIGIEREDEYYKIAFQRIKKATKRKIVFNKKNLGLSG